MLYLTCTTITSIDLAHYGVSRAKDWVSVKCGTIVICINIIIYWHFCDIKQIKGHFLHIACFSLLNQNLALLLLRRKGACLRA